ncbi:MAG: methyl-accepting chemotaxis protein [Ardenticatenaceae bacterium]|nr:methyl-accepting chemotaxis protein [Ardenticatenaceae bacterium]
MRPLIKRIFRAIQRVEQPLAVKIVVAVLIVTLIPLLTIGLFNVRNMQQALGLTINQGLEAEVVGFEKSIATFFSEQVSIIHSLALDETLVAELQAKNAEYAGLSDAAIQAQIATLDEIWTTGTGTEDIVVQTLSHDPAVNRVVGQLAAYKGTFAEHIEIFVTDEYGATLASTDLLSDYYQADEGWWQAAYANGEGAIYISEPEFDESAGVTAVLLAMPVRDESGAIIGIVRSTLVIDALLAEVASIQVGESGHALLVAQDGTVIADPHGVAGGNALTGEMLTAVTDLSQNQNGQLVSQVADATSGDTLVLAASTLDRQSINRHAEFLIALDKLNWAVVVTQSAAEAFVPVTTTTWLFVIALLLGALFAVVASMLLARLLTGQLRRIDHLFERVARGDNSRRIEIVSGDELGKAAQGINLMLDQMVAVVERTEAERDSLQNSIIKLLEEIADLGDGDLTVEAEVTADAMGAVADSINFTIGQLRSVISNVLRTTMAVSLSANKMRLTAEHLAQGSDAQATQITSTSAAVDEMATSVQQVSENAKQSSTVAEQALQTARQGSGAVQNTIEGMQRIRQQGQETAKRIKRLGESSQEVGEIVQVMRSIARRTNLLALNASLEAAAAGDAGRGFAVVAADVKRLSERSSMAAEQVAELIFAMQSETNEAVAAMEATTREVVEGSKLANEAGLALMEIESVSNQLAELIQSISLAATQQARGSETIAFSMNEIATVTQQTAVGTKDVAVAITRLAMLADQLRSSVSTFKLPRSAAPRIIPNGADGAQRNGNGRSSQREALALGD